MENQPAGLPAGQEEQTASAAPAAAAVEGAAAAEAIVVSSGKTKNQRKKANRKAKARASNAIVSSLLAECNSLRHSTVMQDWFSAFHSYKGGLYRTYYVAASELSEECLEWIFLLTKINMQRMYQRTPGWGWNDKGETGGKGEGWDEEEEREGKTDKRKCSTARTGAWSSR